MEWYNNNSLIGPYEISYNFLVLTIIQIGKHHFIIYVLIILFFLFPRLHLHMLSSLSP